MEKSIKKMSKPVAFLVVILIFGGPPILAVVLTNLGSYWGPFIFGLIYVVSVPFIFYLIDEIKLFEISMFGSAIGTFIFVLHFGYMYYRQLDLITEFKGELIPFIAQLIMFIFLSMLLTASEIGEQIASFVTFQ